MSKRFESRDMSANQRHGGFMGRGFGWLAAGWLVAGCQSGQTPTEPTADLDAAPPAVTSGVTRVEVDGVEPAFGGRAFGEAGPYEWVSGRLFAELDPGDPHNAVIVNLDRAPRNANGRVEYSADFRILKPADMTRGNGAIFYDVVNRGRQRAFNLVQGFEPAYGSFPQSAEQMGDGFHLELGYTLVWSGWQHGVADELIGAQLPVAANRDGTPIRAWRTAELRGATNSLMIEDGLYPTVTRSMDEARLYRRVTPHAPPQLLPRDAWSFARCEAGAQPVPSDVHVCLEGGFSPDASYYLVHEARDPIVMGIGFAAVRDAAAFFRYDTTEQNPLVARFGGSGEPRNVITTAVAWGQSQPGRFLRDFVYQGFNRDAAGRPTFDGVFPVTAGARKTFTNYEFANPGRFVRFVNDHYAPGDQFPFSYATILDPVTGRVDGILARCSLTATCPKIMQFDTANELWGARGSLVTTDPLGRYDAPMPENVRIYQWSSMQHNQSGLTGEETPAELAALRDAGECKYFPNPALPRENRRALVVAMHEWLTTGAEPPPSQYSRIDDGTLVAPLPQSEQGFPAIPGAQYSGRVNHLFVNDYAAHPTTHTTAQYTVLVPKVDADGHDLAGIKSLHVEVPLGTHVGWNYRRTGRVQDEGCSTLGSYFPFAATATGRGDDPRPSIEERYGSHAGYVEQVRQAVQRQQDARLLLPQDAEALIRRAERRDIGLPAT
ncbi:MAG: alpha/beta hydrolase domain-containing protein [Rhodospirillaceae bacterium]|nr:alpha/beta hydrolase domain-containing protein [Rhodospirillaceae bacterium]